MWRWQASCKYCDKSFHWWAERQASVEDILTHLRQGHQVAEPREEADYHLQRQRQCDYCLEEYVDTCTKCAHDFCRLHEGFIHGLCGGCI